MRRVFSTSTGAFSVFIVATLMMKPGFSQSPNPGSAAPSTSEADLAVATSNVTAAQANLAKLAVEVAELDRQRDKISNELANKNAELSKISGDTEAIRQKREQLRVEAVALEQHKKDAEVEIAGKTSEIDAQKEELARLGSLLEDKAIALQRLQNEIDAIVSGGADAIAAQLDVLVDGKTVDVNQIEDAELQDASNLCSVQVKLKQTGTTPLTMLRSLGIVGIDLQRLDGRSLPIRENGDADLNRTTVTWSRDEVCGPNRQALENGEALRLVVHSESSVGGEKVRQSVTYPIRYKRKTLQWELGLGTYFGSGSSNDTDARIFSAFPSLRFGLRANIPIELQNPDFYLGASLIFGGGFSLVAANDGQMANSDEVESLTLFAGFTFAIGKYIELGGAYDIRNDNWLFIVGPGGALSQSIFKF